VLTTAIPDKRPAAYAVRSAIWATARLVGLL